MERGSTERTPLVTVLVTTYDGRDVVGAALASLTGQDWDGPWEVVVADNGSHDDTLAVVASFRDALPDLQVLDASDLPGRSEALNAAVRASRGELLLWLDQDDVVAPGWMAAMVRALQDADLVGARLEHRTLNPPWTLAHRGEPQTAGLPQLPGAPFPHSWGCAIGVRRRWHDLVGGADSTAGPSDDIDYCWRVQEAGGRLAFAGDAVVHYRHRTDLADIYRQSRGYGRSCTLLRGSPRWRGTPDPGTGAVQQARAWAGLVKRLPLLPDRRRLGRFAWVLGERVGTWQARHELRRRRSLAAAPPATIPVAIPSPAPAGDLAPGSQPTSSSV